MPTVESYYGGYLIHGRGHGKEGTLVQTDWDFPATAEGLGWSLRRVQHSNGRTRFLKRRPPEGKGCAHRHTDGTITCECGVTASEFIRSASEYLSGLAGCY